MVTAISSPSKSVTCLINRKADVHDIKILPKQVEILNSASQIITLGHEMTPAIKKWLDKPQSLVVGISAIETFDEEHHDKLTEEHDYHFMEQWTHIFGIIR